MHIKVADEFVREVQEWRGVSWTRDVGAAPKNSLRCSQTGSFFRPSRIWKKRWEYGLPLTVLIVEADPEESNALFPSITC